ncbi:DUF1259 domain-containing protein, partial [Burkholderia thailandensis]|uniref:DUF1259 domain-containing protein n=1 Tax=Burkholderia thailandensis TaxID=57975 RepID=UPI00217E224C
VRDVAAREDRQIARRPVCVDDEAVVDGDFAMREDELQTVLKRMRASGINIVAIHQHMTGETPRILFLHYWGKGRAASLAKGVRAALDARAALPR